MRNLQRMCAAAVLTCVITLTASAGDMSAPGVNPPPPPTNSQQATSQGEIQFGLLALLQAVLAVL